MTKNISTPKTDNLQWRQIQASQLTTDFIMEWQELLDRTENSDPFLSIHWLSPWLADNPRNNLLIIGLRNDRLILLMPLHKNCMGIQLGGFIDGEQQDLALICPHENGHALVMSMLTHLKPFMIRLDAMLQNGGLPLVEQCEKLNWSSVATNGKQSPYVETGPCWDTYFKARKKKVRDTYTKRSRKIEKDLKMQTVVVTTPKEVIRWLPTMVQLEQSTWKSSTGLFTSTNFELTRKRLLTLAEAGKLRLFLLLADEQLVAYNYTLLHANRLWYFNTAYDTEYKKVSPGVYQMVEMIKFCFTHRYTSVEMLGERPRYKREWTPLYRQRTTVYLFAPGVSKMIGPLLLHFYRATKERLRRR